MPLISNQFFEMAIDNIAALGDTDIFPLPVENHVLFDMKSDVVALLSSISTSLDAKLVDHPPTNHSALAPVGYNGYRWATQVDPIWNAYLLGVVLSLAQEIENRRVPVDEKVVFSYRFAPKGEHLFDREGWSKFQEQSNTLARVSKYVVSLDIADFYGRIYHHRLDNELKYVDQSGEHASQVMKILGKFSNGASYGLPVGGPAARILSELLLNAIDQILLDQDPEFVFTRYADDYRFFVNDLETAHRAIGFMAEKLQRNEGLSLQRNKTRIMTSAEYLTSTEPQDPRPGSAAKFLNMHLYYDPYSPTAPEDYEHLKESLEEFDVLGLLRAELSKGRVDQTLTKKLIVVLEHMQKSVREQAIRSLLENLETLTPVIPHVMRAIRRNIASLDMTAREAIYAQIRNLIEDGHHLSKVDVNLAYMIRVLAQEETQENARLLTRLFEGPHGHTGAAAPNIQHDIMLILGKWKRTHWLHDRQPHFGTMHPWTKRSFLIASYALQDEGQHWRRAHSKLFSPLDTIVQKWMQSRVQQPGWEIPI